MLREPLTKNASKRSLSILYWNVWCLPRLLTDSKYDSDVRAKLISKHITGYDIVILNEAWTQGAIDVFKNTYPHFAQDGINCNGKIYGSGIMVLSKYPIKNTLFEGYTDLASVDWFTTKGILYFEIEYDNKTYRFITSHMQAGSSKLEQYARLYGSAQLTNFTKNIMTTDPTNTNLWLIGDLNMMPHKGRQSPHTQGDIDSYIRDASYAMIIRNTPLKDCLPDSTDVLRVLSHKNSNNAAHVNYVSTPPLSDGSPLHIQINI